MASLLLRFGIHLEDFSVEETRRHRGPLFHEWLPDGETDAISLETGDPNAQLKVWFERRGFVDGHYIRFDYSRREVDSDVMTRQAILEAGPLLALLKLLDVSEETLFSLRENKVDDPLYVALGKKVVRLVVPLLSRLLTILRTNYGQYWVRDLEEWDSRRRSLGNYCRGTLGTSWSTDGKTWSDFAPTEQTVSLSASFPSEEGFQQYLTSADWQMISTAFNSGYAPSLAAAMLAQTHRFLDEGRLRQAFIEGASALEIALDEFVRRRIGGRSNLENAMSAFWELPLRTRAVSIASSFESSLLPDLELALEAIKSRNRVVHEGWTPSAEVVPQLRALLNSVARLLPGPSFKFPSGHAGNRLRPANPVSGQVGGSYIEGQLGD